MVVVVERRDVFDIGLTNAAMAAGTLRGGSGMEGWIMIMI
jgi:hypothetical protein